MTRRQLSSGILAAAFCAVLLVGARAWWNAGGASSARQQVRIESASPGDNPNPSAASPDSVMAPAGHGGGDPAALSLSDLSRSVQPKGALPNEAVLTFRTKEAYADFLKRAAASGLALKGRLESQNTVRVAFDSLDKLRAELAAHPGSYATAGPIFPVVAPALPPPEQRQGGGGDQPFGASLLSAIGADAGVDRSQWGSGVTVALLDSGVTAHPALADAQIAHIDLVNDAQPFEGHGTAMASLIVGGINGAQGVSPAANILDVRIAGADGTSDSFLLARGIQAALDRGAQVINVSMGSYGDSPVVAQAVSDALARGVVIVASAGNEQSTALDWPAAYPGVISVSGVDATGRIAYYSNSGNPTLAAPGVGIPSAFAQNNQPYLAIGDGTSQAAALVSGAAAAIISQGGNVLSTLINNAKLIPADANQAGAGMLHLSVGK